MLIAAHLAELKPCNVRCSLDASIISTAERHSLPAAGRVGASTAAALLDSSTNADILLGSRNEVGALGGGGHSLPSPQNTCWECMLTLICKIPIKATLAALLFGMGKTKST